MNKTLTACKTRKRQIIHALQEYQYELNRLNQKIATFEQKIQILQDEYDSLTEIEKEVEYETVCGK